ncbi:MAG: hypothetical protein US76_03485 [Parcubacteria group bacterium GW2011_GWA2_38_13b]|nr:MAG: hypothetical protein US76_03485 [Parcubacteria group bacterium GW2011_GWA2_38_13b]
MLLSCDKEGVAHKENIKKLRLKYGDEIDDLYNEKLEYYKDSRVRNFVSIFVMREVLEILN